jgi:hypothetical protein
MKLKHIKHKTKIAKIISSIKHVESVNLLDGLGAHGLITYAEIDNRV